MSLESKALCLLLLKLLCCMSYPVLLWSALCALVFFLRWMHMLLKTHQVMICKWLTKALSSACSCSLYMSKSAEPFVHHKHHSDNVRAVWYPGCRNFGFSLSNLKKGNHLVWNSVLQIEKACTLLWEILWCIVGDNGWGLWSFWRRISTRCWHGCFLILSTHPTTLTAMCVYASLRRGIKATTWDGRKTFWITPRWQKGAKINAWRE